MFTGIISDQGKIITAQDMEKGRLFKIATAYDIQSIDIGASISCNGVCLTVTRLSTREEERWFEVEAWTEALSLTNARLWQAGDTINLERSLRHGDEYGGHMVSGHVDGCAEITSVKAEGDARRFVFKLPEPLLKYIVPKGSIALNGTSLTINNVENNKFDVLLIRHSLDVTTWGAGKAGDMVNIEVDQIARYVVKVAEAYQNQ